MSSTAQSKLTCIMYGAKGIIGVQIFQVAGVPPEKRTASYT